MKKVLLAFFIMLLLTLTTFNAVSINDSNSQPTDTYEPIYPEPMMPGQEITELHDLSEFDSPINIDDTWLTFQNDFDDESAEFLLTFTPPTVEVGDEFLDLFVPECTYSGAGGAPILPHRTTTFTFPPGTIIDEVSFVPNYNLEQLTSIPIRPMPKPLPVMPIDEIFSEQSEQTPEMDPNIYSMDNYYPSNWFEYSTGMGLNPNTDERTLFLVVHTFPIKYNPIENNIQYLTSGTLSINVQEPIDTETQSNSRAAGNAGDGESTGTSRAEVHDMVIICPNIFKSALGDFASFKTTTGIDTKIVTMEEIISSKYFPVEGRDNAEKIKYLLYNAVITWGIKYVLLVGDAERIPTRITHVAESGLNDDEASDLYYSDVFDSSNNFCDWDYTENDRFGEYNGGNDDRLDLYPDLHVGRIPASTTGEVSSMIDKTKNYEIDTIGQPWYKNAILCGLDTFSGGTAEGEYLSDHIARNYLEDFNVIKLYESDNTLTKANIKSNWNNGAGFVSFSDHGLHSSWGGKFSSSDVSALTNNKKVSFVNFDACLTGEFDQGSSDCIAEKTILNNNGGGVAVVASSRIAYGSWGPSHINSVSGYLNVRLYHNMDHTTEIAGALLTYAKIDYIRNVGTSGATNFKTLVEYNHFGDPSLLLGGLPTAIYNLNCESNESTINPGETSEYRVQIENTDIQTRQIKLSTSEKPSGWAVKLSDSSVTLQPGTRTNVTITVSPPEECQANFQAKIKLIAALTNSERTICQWTKTTVKQVYGLEVLCDDKSNITGSTYPNRAINFTFQVCNLGNSADQISLKLISDQEESSSWAHEFSESTVALPFYSEKEVKLTVNIPSETVSQNYTFRIQGKLKGNSKTQDLGLSIHVLRVFGMNLTCPEENLSSDPGRNVTFNLLLENKGNHLELFELYISNLQPTWGVKFQAADTINDTIWVDPFSVLDVKCIVYVPSGTLVGFYDLNLLGRLVGMENDIYTPVYLSLKVNRVYGIGLSSLTPEVDLDPGEVFNFYLEVNNLGNNLDYADVEILDKPSTWLIDFDVHDSLSIPANEKRFLGVKIIPDDKALVDRFNIFFRATLAGDGSTIDYKQVVEINRINNLSITQDELISTIRPDTTSELEIQVINLGNAGDSVTLTIPEQLSDCTATLIEPGTNNLIAYGEEDVGIKLEVDKNAIAGLHSIPLIGRLGSTGENYSFDVEFFVEHIPGIDLIALNNNIKTQPGEEIMFEVSIQHTGNGYENFTFEVRGVPNSWSPKFPISQIINLDPFTTKNLTLSIMIPSDEEYQDVELEVRIQSRIDQKTNSILILKVSIEEEKSENLIFGMNQNTLGISLVIIIIIIILISLGSIQLKKRKKDKKPSDSKNIFEYSYSQSSDGSRVAWEESPEPLPVQYNPPTPTAAYGQPFELQAQSPNTYRSQTAFPTPVQYYDQNAQFGGELPAYNDPLLPGFNNNNNGLDFKSPDTYTPPEETVTEPIIIDEYSSDSDDNNSDTDLEIEAETDPGSELEVGSEDLDLEKNEEYKIKPRSKSQPVTTTQKREDMDISFNFKLPLSKTTTSRTSKKTEDEQEVEPDTVAGPDGDQVKFFEVEDNLTWKRPKSKR